jgi:truncated hemoglobin YjbI
MAELVTPINKTSADLANARKRTVEVMAKLGNLKNTFAAASVSGGGPPNLRAEVAKMKENVGKFKELLLEAAKVQVVTESSGSFASMRKKQMIDDPTRSLLERIGGDLSLETALEIVYNKTLLDSRLRAFFEKNQRKVLQIRKKMQDFLTGFLGGHKLYDDANLKPAHYHMNITDFHVDAMLELFAGTFQEMGVHPDAAADALAHIGKIRKDLTTGCTVRMEMARKSVEKGKDALFKNLGGVEGMQKFLDRVYDLIVVDARLKKFFQGRNLVAIKEAQRIYITELIGGPKIYKGRALDEVHKGLGVDDYLFDCFLMDCEKALSGLGLEDQTIDEVLVVLEPVRAPVIGRERGVSGAGGATKGKIVNGKTILERLGGEMNLEAIIETAYNGFVIDPRIKFFFADKPAAKIADLKQKFAAAIASTIGGPPLYDVSKLRQFHYDMNITSYSYDAAMENFLTSCELMEVEKAVLVDFTEALQKFRSDITAGCTVRLELAMKKTETAGTDNLFGVLGRKDGVRRLIKEVYKYVTVDNRVNYFFSGSKLEALMEAQGRYLAELFGSSEAYEGRELEKVHSMINVSDFHFDCFLEATGKALKDIGSDSSTVDECTVLLESTRLAVVNPGLRKHNTRKAQEMASRKTLYDRLGGEAAFTKIADLMYEAAMLDDRLKSFFEKNKAKIQSIKKKMAQYMVKIAGGTSTYDVSDMKPAHYAMNVTDWHFDTMLEIIQVVLTKEMQAKKGDIREFIRKLQPVRQEVTTGCTVRSDIAKANLSKGKDQLFVKMGKGEGITKYVDQLFEVVLSDPRIRTFFDNVDKQKVKTNHTIFVTELLGGPKVYKGQDIGGIHKALQVTDYHFDAFLNDATRALMGAGKSEALIDEVLITLESVRAEVLCRDTSPASLPGVMRDSKSLMERVGGDMAVESLIDASYDKAMEDSRLRYFFDKPKQKIRQIKQRMYQYMSGAYGGPVQYDASLLKGVHTNMNLTDYHFDAFLEAFVVTAKEMNIDGDSLEDAMIVMNRVRSDVTTGCTVRMELARKRIQQDGLAKVFERLGGKEGMESIMQAHWEFVDRDKRISSYFEGAKTKIVKTAIGDYISMVVGGPGKYNGRPLEEVHQIINVNDHHFDAFIQDFQRAVRDCGASSDVVDDCVVCIEALRKKILVAVYSKIQ